MLSLRLPKSVVAAAIVLCALVAALPSAGSRLGRRMYVGSWRSTGVE